MSTSKCVIISGRSHPELAKRISDVSGFPVVPCDIKDFNDGNINVKIRESVRGKHVYIVQTSCSDGTHSTNDFLQELLLIMDACNRADVHTMTVINPNYFNARSDKKDVPRVPIGAKVTMLQIEAIGGEKFRRMISLDLHAPQIQGYTDRPFDNLYAINIMIAHFNATLFAGMNKTKMNELFVLAAPDNGAAKRVEAYATKLGMDFIIMHKQRIHSQPGEVAKMVIVGDEETYKGKTVIVIDDMVDTFGTMAKAADNLVGMGAKDIVVVATHGILSGPALERINRSTTVTKVVVTNSSPQEMNVKMCPKIEVVDCGCIIGEVLKQLTPGGSVSKLFD